MKISEWNKLNQKSLDLVFASVFVQFLFCFCVLFSPLIVSGIVLTQNGGFLFRSMFFYFVSVLSFPLNLSLLFFLELNFKLYCTVSFDFSHLNFHKNSIKSSKKNYFSKHFASIIVIRSLLSAGTRWKMRTEWRRVSLPRTKPSWNSTTTCRRPRVPAVERA